MPQLHNTFDTVDSGRNRETLSDLVDRITPEEVPLYTLIGTEKVEGVNPQWNQDKLRNPTLNNKRPQGDVYSYKKIEPTKKVGNYTQIFMEEYLVAETQDAVSKAGNQTDSARAKLQAGLVIKTDIEVTLASNQASVPFDGGNVPAQMAGLRAWIATNDLMGAGGVSGGYNPTTQRVDAAVDGAQRAFTRALLAEAIGAAYTQGGSPTIAMVSPYAKTVFSGFMSDPAVAQQRTTTKSGQQRISAAAEEYQSDFGLVTIMPNRQWARHDQEAGAAILTRNAFLLQPDKLKVGVLRPIQEDKDVAKTGDAKPGVMKAEVTLIVKNEAALAVIADLYGRSAAA